MLPEIFLARRKAQEADEHCWPITQMAERSRCGLYQLTVVGFCDSASWANCEVRENTNKVQQLDVYYQHFLNMFRAPLCPSSGEHDVCYCKWCAALVLLDVVDSGCGALSFRVRALWRLLFDSVTFTVLTPHKAAPHNRYQPHPAEPAQHTTCSNTRLVLLKMGIVMPETCWESVDNKHLTVASCWYSLSLHNQLTVFWSLGFR